MREPPRANYTEASAVTPNLVLHGHTAFCKCNMCRANQSRPGGSDDELEPQLEVIVRRYCIAIAQQVLNVR